MERWLNWWIFSNHVLITPLFISEAMLKSSGFSFVECPGYCSTHILFNILQERHETHYYCMWKMGLHKIVKNSEAFHSKIATCLFEFNAKEHSTINQLRSKIHFYLEEIRFNSWWYRQEAEALASELGLRFYRICVKQNLYVTDGQTPLPLNPID
jgi:hypothetical protein